MRYFYISILVIGLIGIFGLNITVPQDVPTTKLVVKPGQRSWEITKTLEEKNIIHNAPFFFTLLVLTQSFDQIQAGTYTFQGSMSPLGVFRVLQRKPDNTIRITLPEGSTVKDIEARLKQVGINVSFSKVQWKEIGRDFPFLAKAFERHPASFQGEGYLFPDTYEFYDTATAEEIARVMLSNFLRRVESLMEEVDKKKVVLDDVVIVASLIEREVKFDADRAPVSDIIWRRLKEGIPLQIDAAIVYIKEQQGNESARVIDGNDLTTSSPYNTYLNAGLPPGAIANPGLKSIEAAVRPRSNNFWYYLSRNDGVTIFSETLEEHNLAKAKYLK